MQTILRRESQQRPVRPDRLHDQHFRRGLCGVLPQPPHVSSLCRAKGRMPAESGPSELRTVRSALRIAAAFWLAAAPLAADAADVLASRGDNARTGANLRETLLTIDNVNDRTFGRIAVHPL